MFFFFFFKLNAQSTPQTFLKMVAVILGHSYQADVSSSVHFPVKFGCLMPARVGGCLGIHQYHASTALHMTSPVLRAAILCLNFCAVGGSLIVRLYI